MELVYITRAIRRYWWITAACIALGLLAGLLLSPARGRLYEAEAWIQISSPSQAFGGSATDRDVQNNLVALGSDALAHEVADGLEGVSPKEAREATTFEQIPGSDIIRVITSFDSAEAAQSIANRYVDQFIELSRAQRDAGRAPDLEALESNIAQLDEQLADVNDRIDEVLRPYVERAAADGASIIPVIDQVAPGLAAERDTLRTEHTELVRIRTDLLVSSAQSELGTRAVQRAPLPEVAQAQRISLLSLAFVFGGAALGGLLAVALARLSPRVLDSQEVSETLGVPIACTIPRHRAPASIDQLLADPLPPALAPSIHELCVRVEAAGEVGGPLVVMVAGAQQGAGTTTIAVAMASHFADAGASVLLLDVDARNPQLSEAVAEQGSGVERFLAPEGSGRGSRDDSDSASSEPLPVAEVTFAGLGSDDRRRPLLRREVHQLVERARGRAHVVVVDAGALMSSASNVELARLADAVVLCVPEKHQRSQVLDVVGRQLSDIRGALLPVLTAASGRHAGHAVHPSARDAAAPGIADPSPHEDPADHPLVAEPDQSGEPPAASREEAEDPTSRSAETVTSQRRPTSGSRGTAARSRAR